MIEVKAVINGSNEIANIKAVRISPSGSNIMDGTLCQYSISVKGEIVDVITFPFGDGVALSIKMLELYRDNGKSYRTIALCRRLSRDEVLKTYENKGVQ